MILDFDGAVGRSSLDHYTIGDTIFLHIHLFALITALCPLPSYCLLPIACFRDICPTCSVIFSPYLV